MDNDVEYVRADRIKELEAKLAKAVEALELAEQLHNAGILDAPDGLFDLVTTTRKAVLAELKGENQ